MTEMNEKRSGGEGNAPPPSPPAQTPPDPAPGVGGRQPPTSPSSQGGGYLNNCTAFKPRLGASKKIGRDPRLDELRAMGLHATWQKVAHEIGMDAFLAMWRIVEAEQQWHHPKGLLQIPLRHYTSYLRFQRNLYLKSLARSGLSRKEIHQRLFTAYGEKLCQSHMIRIIEDL